MHREMVCVCVKEINFIRYLLVYSYYQFLCHTCKHFDKTIREVYNRQGRIVYSWKVN